MGEEKPKVVPIPIGGVWPTVKPFANGGLSGMLATCVIQPIDMIKVRVLYPGSLLRRAVCFRLRGKLKYRKCSLMPREIPVQGSLDCAMKTSKAGGPFKFYTGFPLVRSILEKSLKD
ncbi:hypothetical protein OSB04_009976 [Centaurea solstitialis]|uniref:Uncharacterized protein n=1 Tax=Centaurea solstitialis TaxID=347529 RepID=A0AA38WCE2_9ASTR|nr:hypothetical protein OSB04_009976 [Centaurea solstitialis]